MATSKASSRLRRAATLTVLVSCAIVGHVNCLFAQEVFSQDFDGSGEFVISDGEFACGDELVGCGDCSPAADCCQTPYKTCWVGGEFLLWRLDGTSLPPLVTDSPSSTPTVDAGQLDQPSTQILSGDDVVGGDWRNGFRVFAGVWLDCCQCWSLEGDYFHTGQDDYDFYADSDPTRILTRPFYNTQLNEDDAQLVSVPNELDGSVAVSADDEFQGAGMSLTSCLWRCCDPCGCRPTRQVSLLGGYRYYQYDSQLTITENLTVLPGTQTPLVPGTTIFVQDRFTTRNDFNGGEIGLQGYAQHCWWWVDGTAKVAIGSHRRVVFVDGQTINTVPGAGQATFEGGLLTSEVTNIGRYSDDRTAVIPEFRLGVGAQLTCHLSVRASYNVIIWDDVARAASHLPPDLEVDPRNLPPVTSGGGPEPLFPGIQGTQIVAHGCNFGVQLMY